MRQCLKKGTGITICPEKAVADEIRQGTLTALPWDQADAMTSVIMIWHAEKWCSPLLNDFMKTAQQFMGQQEEPFKQG